MPAISPARLKNEIAQLGEHFGEPARFTAELDRLLDFYADRTRRPGQVGMPAPLLPAYQTALPVIRQIENELARRAAANPAGGLSLAERLWASAALECKRFAIHTLRHLPPAWQPAAARQFEQWSAQPLPAEILEDLYTAAAAISPAHTLQRAASLLENPDETAQARGFTALIALARHAAEDALPPIFKLLPPFIAAPSPELKRRLLELTRALARRIPQETAFFLRQNFIITEQRAFGWLIRQTLPHFPETIRLELQTLLRASPN
jgi:hypothetical protein